MSPVSASQVAELRARTGAGILDAKTALEEAKGNEELAIDILRKKGQAQAVKKAGRQQSEGGVFIAVGSGKAALVSLKCETDFVGRSVAFLTLGGQLSQALLQKGEAGFKAFAEEKIPAAVLQLGENISIGEMHRIEAPTIGTYVHSNRKIGVIVGLDKGTSTQAVDAAMHAAAMNPQYVQPGDVTADVVAKEREIWKEQMKGERKPPEIQEKIMAGKERKFREESALMTQSFVKDPAQTVGTMLGGAKVTAYVRVAFT